MNEIQHIAEQNKEMLKAQIELYKADIIILCGTSEPYKTVMEDNPSWKMTSRGIWYYVDSNGSIIVSAYHPAWRQIPKNYMCYMLIDAIKEIIN